jgi:hypothetical protein
MRKFFLTAVLVLVASGAQAATLTVVGGQLMGASDVLVDGSLYDVQFLDGTCIDLYNGCDDTSDFTFQTSASAFLASQALLDQVFLDGPLGLFDVSPLLTNGCSDSGACVAATPYFSGGSGLYLYERGAYNWWAKGPDLDHVLDPATRSPSLNYASLDFTGTTHVWAVWSPVPEPSTALLLGLGLAGMAGYRRL